MGGVQRVVGALAGAARLVNGTGDVGQNPNVDAYPEGVSATIAAGTVVAFELGSIKAYPAGVSATASAGVVNAWVFVETGARYWVGGTGSWSESGHWATASNAAGGAPVPTVTEKVYFDAYSFPSTGQTVTIDVTAACLGLDSSTATNAPTLAGTAGLTIGINMGTVGANLTGFAGSGHMTYSGAIGVVGTFNDGPPTIYLAGVETPATFSVGNDAKNNAVVTFDGNFTIGGLFIDHVDASFPANTANIGNVTWGVPGGNNGSQSLVIGTASVASFVSCHDYTIPATFPTTTFKMALAASRFYISGNVTIPNSTASVYTDNVGRVVLNGTGPQTITPCSNATYNGLFCGNWQNSNTAGPVTFEWGVSSFLPSAEVTLDADTRTVFHPKAQLSITYTLTVGGTNGHWASVESSMTDGLGRCTLNLPAATYSWMRLKGAVVNANFTPGTGTRWDLHTKGLLFAASKPDWADGWAGIEATAGVGIAVASSNSQTAVPLGVEGVSESGIAESSGNEARPLGAVSTACLGAVTTTPISVNRYWVGGTGNWSDPGHWATRSGGEGGAPPPAVTQNVIFDALSFTALGQTVTIDTSAACRNFTSSAATNAPILAGSAALSFKSIGDFRGFAGVGRMPYTGTIAGTAVTAGAGGTLYLEGINTAANFSIVGTTSSEYYWYVIGDSVTIGDFTMDGPRVCLNGTTGYYGGNSAGGNFTFRDFTGVRNTYGWATYLNLVPQYGDSRLQVRNFTSENYASGYVSVESSAYGRLRVSGNIAGNPGPVTSRTGCLVLNGTGDQTITDPAAICAQRLHIEKPSGRVLVATASPITVQDLYLGAGTDLVLRDGAPYISTLGGEAGTAFVDGVVSCGSPGVWPILESASGSANAYAKGFDNATTTYSGIWFKRITMDTTTGRVQNLGPGGRKCPNTLGFTGTQADAWADNWLGYWAGGPSVTASVGTATASGQVPPDCEAIPTGVSVTAYVGTATATAAVDRSAAAPTGLSTALGLTATLAASVLLSSPLGAVAVGGLAPTVNVSASTSAPLATATTAGLVPGAGCGALTAAPAGIVASGGLVPTAATSGNASASAPLAVTTAAGLDPTATAARNVSASAPLAAASVAGLTPGAASGASLTTPLGAATSAGLVPTTTASVCASAPLAVTTAAGLDPTATAARNVSASAPLAAATTEGLVPTASAGQSASAGAPLGAAVAAGLVPEATASTNVSVSAPLAAASVAGLAPGASSSASQDATTAAVGVAGLSPALASSLSLASPLGASWTASPAPSASSGATASVPMAMLASEGLPATAGTSSAVAAPAGMATTAGLSPIASTEVSRQADAPTGVLAVAGLSPVASTCTNAFADAPLGAVTTAGPSPSAQWGPSLEAPLGVATFAGLPPTATAGTNVVVWSQTAALVSDGFSVTTSASAALMAAAADLFVVGLPTLVRSRVVPEHANVSIRNHPTADVAWTGGGNHPTADVAWTGGGNHPTADVIFVEASHV